MTTNDPTQSRFWVFHMAWATERTTVISAPDGPQVATQEPVLTEPHSMTFGDLLKTLADADAKLKADDDAIAVATANLAAASQALGAANDVKTADMAQRDSEDQTISQEIVAGGPRFVGPKDDGSIDVYLPNADGNGYHLVNVKPSSGDVTPTAGSVPIPLPGPTVNPPSPGTSA